MAAIAAGAEPPERWRHPEIRLALRMETGAKCAYCEAFVDDVAYPHVEHIIPKKLRPELVVRWANLTSACGRCNLAKRDFYHDTDGLLNPYVDPIDAHLNFLGTLITSNLGDVRGAVTVRKLQLNRLDLVYSRLRRLEAVGAALDTWHEASEPLKSVIADGIRRDAEEGEFSRSVTAYLRSFGFV